MGNEEAGGHLGLVLSGGGARGAFQAGVLRAIAEKLGGDRQPFDIITGVSAGALNAAGIAGHGGSFSETTEKLITGWQSLTIEHVYKADFAALFGSALRWVGMLGTGNADLAREARGMLDTTPLRGSLAAAIDVAGIDRNVREGRLRALALSASDYTRGGTVTFVHGVEGLQTWRRAGRRAVLQKVALEHVMASCALPLIFPAVKIGDGYYGDGSVRQRVPLSPAIHLGADRLIVISVSHPTGKGAERKPVRGYPVPSQILGVLLNAIFLDSLEADAERMERINRTLKLFPAGLEHPTLRRIRLLKVHPSRDLGELSADLGKHLPRSMRLLVRGLGGRLSKSPDFLSYLLFERPYTERLLELGYEDGKREWPRIERFLAGEEAPEGTEGFSDTYGEES